MIGNENNPTIGAQLPGREQNVNDFVFFVSYLDFSPVENDYSTALCIDIRGASTQSGALLQTFPRKPNCYDNQLWKLDPSGQTTSGGGPWNFIRSKMNDNFVITINGQSLEVSTQKKPDSDDQLWTLNKVLTDGFGNEWYDIQTKQNNGNVISVKGSSLKAGTPLEMDTPIQGKNQLWLPI